MSIPISYHWFVHEGHGGRDVGAVGPTKLYEKDVTLKVGKKVKTLLELHNQKVTLARGKDIDLKSYDGANTANKLNVDFVISIHCNSATNSTATGTETFAYSTTSKGNELAHSVQKHLVNAIKLPDRGVKYGSFSIISKPKAPAILVEIAFINNPKEEKLLRDDKFLDKVAVGIVKGLLEHVNIKYTSLEERVIIEMSKYFKDIPKTHWGAESADRMYDKGIIKGKQEGVFDPDNSISRIEIAVVADRIINHLTKYIDSKIK